MLSTKDFKEKQILFVFLNRGEKISFKNDNIVIKDIDDKIKHQSTCYRLFALFISGNLTITTGIIQRAEKFGFSIVLMTTNLRVYQVLLSKAEGNVLLRKKQYNYDSFDIGAYIISNKIHNQATALRNIRDKSSKLKSTIELLDENTRNVRVAGLSLNEIMGIEGISAKIYFTQMFSDFDWIARRPRVKHDMMNCLLDIGYNFLFNMIDALLSLYGFDTYTGVLHRQFYQRKSLVCDLVEPFRPLIDMRIRKAINLGQCREKDFTIIQGQYFLFGKEAAPYIAWLLEVLIERKSELFLYVQNYYRAFMKNKAVDDFPFFKL